MYNFKTIYYILHEFTSTRNQSLPVFYAIIINYSINNVRYFQYIVDSYDPILGGLEYAFVSPVFNCRLRSFVMISILFFWNENRIIISWNGKEKQLSGNFPKYVINNQFNLFIEWCTFSVIIEIVTALFKTPIAAVSFKTSVKIFLDFSADFIMLTIKRYMKPISKRGL